MSRGPKCPGCGVDKPDGALCCDWCWKNLPTSIEGLPRIRSTLKELRNRRRWDMLEDAHVTIQAWLRQHYVDRTMPFIASGDQDDPPNSAYRTGAPR